MADDLSFTVELEYDPIKNAELGSSLSRIADPEKSEQPSRLEYPTAIQAGSEDAGGSYLSIIASTIQTFKPNHTLFVWKAYFHPGLGRRFQNAVITYKFSSPSASPLEIIAYAPRKSFGGCSSESRTASWTVEFPLIFTGGGLVEVGMKPSGANEKSKEVEHAFTITGTARGVPRRTTCVWTLEENSSTERGIPSEVEFAVVVRHDDLMGLIQCEVRASAKTGGGGGGLLLLLPGHYLRAKTAVEDCRRVIDPAVFVGKLREYDLGKEGEGVEGLLKGWTGEVEGAVLEFGGGVVRS
ncbi:hypothetical protein QBC38DRAFT_514333 [Podospora fimiseda]|uniref:Uncharacterized protein n=1 Tax=Podospora fimiseda TaxID=252190 RepID=A0AAN7BZP6_9PEZI|nr:hypothetical protein QBC38DRAFT_514333 [Podospora fimiseda]